MKSLLPSLAVAAALVIAPSLWAQERLPAAERDLADSTGVFQTAPDTAAPEPTGSGLDTSVVYSATDSITFSAQSRMMDLYGKGELRYRTIGLKAERIDIDWTTATLGAIGVPDSSDTTGSGVRGAPILIDGGEKYDGSRVTYNFRTRKGRITLGETSMEEGFYYGERIKKVESDVLFVGDGRYTTCDLGHPHYYFTSPRMKVIVGDVVVAEPVFFYIAEVPVFALPFGIFPSGSGRRSGLIAPAYGADERFGQFLSHLGYYWAISDYMDYAGTFDLYSKGGWAHHSLYRYALRYNFTGSLAFDFTNKFEGEPTDPDRSGQRDYRVNVTHNQNIDPTMNLNVNFTFASGTYFRNHSTTLNDILQQNIVSNATLTKSWAESNRSMSIFVRRDQSLVSGGITELLPSISFSQNQWYPFRSKGSAIGGSASLSWYETVGFNYSANASNGRTKSATTIDGVKTGGTVSSVETFAYVSTQSISQNVSMSVAPKLGYFTLSPSLSFRDDRTFQSLETPTRDPLDSTLVTTNSRFQRTAGFLSAGLSTGTRIFGIAQPEIWGITALRHTLSPNLSMTYSKQVYGQGASPASMVASLSIQNLFEMKVQPVDTVEEQKIQLLNLGMNLSYNFNAPSQKLSPLGMSYRTNIQDLFSFSASTTHNFYVYDRALGRRIDKFLLAEKGYLADLTSLTLSVNTSLSGESTKKSAAHPQQVLAEQERSEGLLPSPGSEQATSQFFPQDIPDFDIPWRLGLIFTYNLNRANPDRVTRSASLSANLSFNLTEKWKIEASGSYDLILKKVAAPTVRISRDLHCWVLNFWWQPIGFYRGYRVEIRVKASVLQDLKLTKQSSARGVYY